MTGFERFIEIMEIKPSIEDSLEAITIKGKIKGEIEFRDVTFSYDENRNVLHNINLKIHYGEVIALVGPSGGGKTTFCSLIPRFYEVNSGEVLIDGINVKTITLKSLRDNIGLVQQKIFLFTGTISENILYGKPEATEEEMIQAAKMPIKLLF